MTRSRQSSPMVLSTLAALGFWLAGAIGATAQDAPPRESANHVYVEVGGAGFATVNYERLLFSNAGLRVGGGGIPMYGNSLVVMPHAILGKKHQIEVGVGVLVAWSPDVVGAEVLLSAEIAYRFQLNDRFFLRVALARFDSQVLPGFSVGLKF